MKKLIIAGVMVIVIVAVGAVLGFKREEKLYEYYDIEGNYGTSDNCISTLNDLICKTKKGWVKVSQYSELVNE